MSRGRGNIAAWALRRPGLMLLTAGPERLARTQARHFTWAWVELVLVSAAWGGLSIGIFGGLWRVLGGSQPLVGPAVVLAAVTVLGPFRRGVWALAGILAGPKRPVRWVLVAAAFCGLACCLAFGRTEQHHNEHQLPLWLGWIRPDVELFRVLLLMPLWGAWAMLITLQFRRPGRAACPAVKAAAARCGPLTAAAMMGLLVGATTLYLGFLAWELTISGATIAAAIGGGALLARRDGGVTLGVLQAVNLVAQFAFVLTYLANVPR